MQGQRLPMVIVSLQHRHFYSYLAAERGLVLHCCLDIFPSLVQHSQNVPVKSYDTKAHNYVKYRCNTVMGLLLPMLQVGMTPAEVAAAEGRRQVDGIVAGCRS